MTSRKMFAGLVLLAVVIGGATAVATARGGSLPRVGGPTNPALARQGVVWHGNDLGGGERLLLVVGGSFPTRQEAVEANESIMFGDLQGYYVAGTDQFIGLQELLNAPGHEYVLVTAFRTDTGAREFMQLAGAAEAPARLMPRLKNRGFSYVGLGQEAHPDGSGPLIGPLAGVST